jgi:LAO/AO transport system kinase
VVVLVPGFGDDVQNMKAGLMEIGDIFVINKADREGAERLEQQLHAMLHLVTERGGWKPVVLRTVATENKGIDALAGAVADFRQQFQASSEHEAKKIAHWKERLVDLLEARLLERVLGDVRGERALAELAAEVAARKKDPYAAVSEILARAGIK